MLQHNKTNLFFFMPLRHIKKHPIKFTTLVITLALVAAGVFLPWKIIAHQKLIEALAQNGFADAEVNITDIGFSSAHLEQMRLTKDASPLFDKMTLHFAPADLIQGHLRHLNFTGLNLELQQNDAGWLINGAPLKTAAGTKPQPTSLPVSDAAMASIPLDSAKLESSAVHMTTDAWKLDAPIAITFKKTPETFFDATSDAVEVKASGATINAADIHAKINLDASAQKWKGTWQTGAINIKGQDNLIPTLTGNGTLNATADTLSIEGKLSSKDNTTHAAFALDYPLNAPEKAQFRLSSAALPWNKGIISLKDTIIPLSGKDDVLFTLKVEHVPVNALMKMLTGKETNATGDVSGSIPVTLKPDGDIAVGQGKLQTEKPGIISLSPETIPGDNEQIALVREVMKNLHYELLSIGLDSDANHKLSVLMAVEGNNPDVVEGHPVKLNVHLTGDLLNLVQQSLLSLVDPNAFLKKQDLNGKQHAK